MERTTSRTYLLGLCEPGRVLAWRGKIDCDEGLLRVVDGSSYAPGEFVGVVGSVVGHCDCDDG